MTKITVLLPCSFFHRDKVEFISKNVHGKLAIRAVLNNDMKLLQSLIENKEEVYKVFEHVREKTNNLGFRPGPTQTSLFGHRKKLDA